MNDNRVTVYPPCLFGYPSVDLTYTTEVCRMIQRNTESLSMLNYTTFNY